MAIYSDSATVEDRYNLDRAQEQSNKGSDSSSAPDGGGYMSLFAAIGDLIGGRRDERTNRRAYRENRGWEEMMSNSAYQRSVADMRMAGLNPAMMYAGGGSGAGTPTVSPPETSASRGFGSSALSAMQMSEQIKLLKEQIRAVDAQSINTAADTSKKQSEVELNNHIGEQIRADTNLKRVNSALAAEQIPEAKASAKFWSQESGDTMKSIQNILRMLGIGK